MTTPLDEAAQALIDDLGNGSKLNMAEPFRPLLIVQLSSADIVGMAEAALRAFLSHTHLGISDECLQTLRAHLGEG